MLLNGSMGRKRERGGIRDSGTRTRVKGAGDGRVVKTELMNNNKLMLMLLGNLS